MSLLAVDLKLPIPEPFSVQLIDGFIDALPRSQAALADEMRQSIFPTFGCRKLPPGFTIWNKERVLSESLLESAAEIFAFDALTLNPDRRSTNPNCQCNGAAFAIFDHEYALMTHGIGGALLPPPWQRDGLRALTHGDGEHVLYQGLHRRGVSLQRLQTVWQAIPRQRFDEYVRALPECWAKSCSESLNHVTIYLNELHDHLDTAFAEVRRVLA